MKTKERNKNRFKKRMKSLVFLNSFHNTINYLTIQINNETSFENTTTKGLLL